MSTVAPSAPAPAVVDASASGAKGETADPAAFAAEFESALGELTSATTAPTDALPADTTSAAPALPAAPIPTAATPVAPALPAPAAPSELTDSAPLLTPVTAEVVAPEAPISVISGGDAEGSVAAAATPELAAAVDAAAPVDDSDETPDAPADAPAPDASPDLAAVLPLPLPAPAAALPVAAPVTTAATPAASAVSAVGSAPATDAAAPAPTDAAAPAPLPVVTAAPAVSTLQAPDEVAAPAAPARAQAPDLVGQLARPLHGLRSFGDGTHVITVRVTPENLGPVAVRAHVSGDSMRIELVAPTDIAREAIKAILPDLRRDLSGAGGQATLDLSSGNQPSGRDSAPRDAPSQSRGNDSPSVAPAPGIRTALRHDVGLDVLA